MPIAAFAATAPLPEQPSSWTFRVLLDGQSIGEHRFTTTPSADGGRTVRSEAAFAVRWLGVTLYQYRHRSVERWRGDCVVGIVADTDENGERTRVSAASQGDVLAVSAPTPLDVPGCVMTFAYWNPALRSQQRLLNAQTGRLESIRMVQIGDGTADHGGRPPGANGWRIDGLPQPIFVWFAPQGDWLGLDTRVKGGRMLSYRLP